jgi:hypothetical protein
VAFLFFLPQRAEKREVSQRENYFLLQQKPLLYSYVNKNYSLLNPSAPTPFIPLSVVKVLNPASQLTTRSLLLAAYSWYEI